MQNKEIGFLRPAKLPSLHIIKYIVGSSADINLLLECGMYGGALAAATASTSRNGTTENLEYLEMCPCHGCFIR